LNFGYAIATDKRGTNSGEFGMSYASCGAIASVIRCCPPTPLDLMRGILEAIGRLPARKGK
jgi:Ni,Fe-hydrogenase III small subunit